MKYNELVKGMYVKEGDVDWVKLRIDFDVEEFSKMLINHKDVFEANKGKGRIDVCLSKGGKLYATLSTFKPQAKEEVSVKSHLAEREEPADLPF
jgi:hypothetical protein